MLCHLYSYLFISRVNHWEDLLSVIFVVWSLHWRRGKDFFRVWACEINFLQWRHSAKSEPVPARHNMFYVWTVEWEYFKRSSPSAGITCCNLLQSPSLLELTQAELPCVSSLLIWGSNSACTGGLGERKGWQRRNIFILRSLRFQSCSVDLQNKSYCRK
jgi:hypothetical protein